MALNNWGEVKAAACGANAVVLGGSASWAQAVQDTVNNSRMDRVTVHWKNTDWVEFILEYEPASLGASTE